MATSIVTPDLDAIVSEIFVAAPAERVFQALTSSEQLMRWWGEESDCKTSLFEMDARPGGKWRFLASDPTGKIKVNGVSDFEAHGEILECVAPRLLVYTWIANWHDRPEQTTVVRWQLTSAAGGTRVKVTHSGLTGLDVARTDYSGGWSGVMEMLKRFAEKQ
jgi:uncharacterized protein YndB with AHSA1/START domain